MMASTTILRRLACCSKFINRDHLSVFVLAALFCNKAALCRLC